MRSLTESRGSSRAAALGVVTALALIFSYIEFLVPLPIAIPGIKLGLANIVVLISLYALGPRYAFFVNVTRIALAALLFGSLGIFVILAVLMFVSLKVKWYKE